MTIGFSVEARYLAITPIVDPNILTQMLRQLTSSSKPPKPKKNDLNLIFCLVRSFHLGQMQLIAQLNGFQFCISISISTQKFTHNQSDRSRKISPTLPPHALSQKSKVYLTKYVGPMRNLDRCKLFILCLLFFEPFLYPSPFSSEKFFYSV